MPRWNTETIVAGTDFSECRVTLGENEIYDGLDTDAGTISYAADGTPHVQKFDIPSDVVGLALAIDIPFATMSKLTTMRTAIKTASDLGHPFRVQIVGTEGMSDLDVVVWKDYNQRWFIPGPFSEGQMENVSMHFIIAGLSA